MFRPLRMPSSDCCDDEWSDAFDSASAYLSLPQFYLVHSLEGHHEVPDP
jgi:hypothetical protein